MLQWYSYTPASSKVKEKVWPVPRVLEKNICPSAMVDVGSFTTVCGAASRFVQVTVVPLGTVIDGGLKAKFWMVTETIGGGTGEAGGVMVRVMAVV